MIVDDDEQGADGSILYPIVGISGPSHFQTTTEYSRQATGSLATRRMTPFKPRLSIPADVNVAVPSSFEQAKRRPSQGLHTPEPLYASSVIPSCFENDNMHFPDGQIVGCPLNAAHPTIPNHLRMETSLKKTSQLHHRAEMSSTAHPAQVTLASVDLRITPAPRTRTCVGPTTANGSTLLTIQVTLRWNPRATRLARSPHQPGPHRRKKPRT